MLKRLRQAAGTRHRLAVSVPISTIGALAPLLLAVAFPYCPWCGAMEAWSDDAYFALGLLLGVVLGAVYAFPAALGALIGFALLLAYSTTLPSRGDAGMGVVMLGICIVEFFVAAVAAAVLRTVAKLVLGARPE